MGLLAQITGHTLHRVQHISEFIAGIIPCRLSYHRNSSGIASTKLLLQLLGHAVQLGCIAAEKFVGTERTQVK